MCSSGFEMYEVRPGLGAAAGVVVSVAARGLGWMVFVSEGASPASGRPAL